MENAYICPVKLRYLAIVVLLLVTALHLQGQILHAPRDIGPAMRQAPKLLLGMDSRHSFISARDVKVMGLRVGLDFDSRARMGFGVYVLASEFHRTFLPTGQPGRTDTIHNAKLQFTYLSAYFEYVVLMTKRWECSVPIHIGIGDVGFQQLPEEPKTVLLAEGTVLAHYKIFPFFGLGGGVGYRQMIAGGELIRENFNSPTYSFGLKFWLGYLYEKLIKKQPTP
jgi:hypothetical protein